MLYDLIFLNPTGANSYSLVRWEKGGYQTTVLVTEEFTPSGQKVEPFPSDVDQYSITSNGKRIALVRYRWKGPRQLREIALLDLDTHQLVSLAQFEGLLNWIAISPDGQWVAYVSSGIVYTLRVGAPGHRPKLGWCGEYECYGLAWSPDSKTIVWSNESGVWLGHPGKPGERLLASDMVVEIRDGKRAVYAPPPWSLDGRYLLARAVDNRNEWYVIDTQTNRIGLVPASSSPFEHTIHLAWISDERLFVVRNGNPQTGAPPSTEIWRVDWKSRALLILEKSFQFPVSPETLSASPVELTDGRLAFLLTNTMDKDLRESGLYVISMDTGVTVRLIGPLPAGYSASGANADWVPDGSGAIFQDWSIGMTVYISINGSMGPSMPAGACCFTWTK